MLLINSIPPSAIAVLKTNAGVFQFATLGQNASSISGEPVTPTGATLLTGNLLLNLPGSKKLEGKPFCVYANGYISLTAGTATVTPTVYLLGATPTNMKTPTTSQALSTLTATALTISSAVPTIVPFYAAVECSGDSTSGLLTGIQYGSMKSIGSNNATLISNIPTGIQFTDGATLAFGITTKTSEPALQFSVIVGGTNTLFSSATLLAFYVEA